MGIRPYPLPKLLFVVNYRYLAVNPPSTNSSVPVMYDASSEAINSTALATSMGRPSRPMGIAANLASWLPPSPLAPEVSMAGMLPGLTELTRMPLLACCIAAALVTSRTAPLEAL